MSSRERMATAAVGIGVAAASIVMALPARSQTAPAAPPSAAGGDTAAKIAKGRDLFANYGGGSCHSLSDAGATGHVGPSLDGDTSLTQAFVVDRVTNGQGPMPAFAGQMSPAEIADVATYVTHVATK